MKLDIKDAEHRTLTQEHKTRMMKLDIIDAEHRTRMMKLDIIDAEHRTRR